MSVTFRSVKSRVSARIIFAFLLVLANRSDAGELVVEGGGLLSPYFVLSDGNRPNAADDWDLGANPTIRAEYWWHEQEDWKFGAVLLPFYLKTEQRLSSDLSVEGQHFSKNENVSLEYQFHNVRGTASYRLYTTQASAFRIGGSLILRYAEIKVSNQSKTAKNTNLAAFPLLHLEYRRQLSPKLAFLVRGDALPLFGIREGFYDFLIGLEGANKESKRLSFSGGLRLFWGGFSPKDEGKITTRYSSSGRC